MKIIIRTIFLILFFNISSFSQKDSSLLKKIIQKTEFSGNWYLAYKYNLHNNDNNFELKRGYLTLKSKLNKYISVRYTQDITLDKEGSDAGNIEIRMKYLYMKLKPFRKGVLKNSFAEFGLVHRPFVDFEQKINAYRSQGKMFIEKVGIVNTSDFGVLYGGLIGGKLNNTLQNKVGKHHPGKYGSFAIGIYNGGGYHAIEANNNKTIEGRLTIRPLPNKLTGLQFSYGSVYGKGNSINDNNDFIMSLFAMTYENPIYILTSQYYIGKGDYKGKYLDINNASAKNEGYSIFGEIKIPKTSFAIFGRYDNFSSNQNSDYFKSGYFGGITYRFLKSKVFVFYGKDNFSNNEENIFEIVLEVAF